MCEQYDSTSSYQDRHEFDTRHTALTKDTNFELSPPNGDYRCRGLERRVLEREFSGDIEAGSDRNAIEVGAGKACVGERAFGEYRRGP